MATTDITHVETSHWTATLRQAVEVGGARLVAVWTAAKNRRSVGRLLAWDDRMLRDIGLTHGDVHAALTARLQDDPSATAERAFRRAPPGAPRAGARAGPPLLEFQRGAWSPGRFVRLARPSPGRAIFVCGRSEPRLRRRGRQW